MEWKRQSPTGKSIPTSALLEEAKAKKTTAEGAGRYQKVLVLMYEQSKPSRQRAMLLEGPASRHGGSGGVIRGGLSRFHSDCEHWSATFSNQHGMAPWFLAEAMKASDAGQFALCEDFVAALRRLQRTSSFKASEFTLWEHLREKNEKCCSEAVQKSQDDQSPMSFRLFVALQRVGRDNESAEDGWNKINELLKKCTSGQILDATSSIVCAASSPSELVLPPGFGFSGVMTFLESIGEPQQLTKLVVHLGGEKTGFSGAQALGEQLSKFQQITTLELRLQTNNLGSEGGKAVGESLGKLQEITTLVLWLDNNNLGTEAARALADHLSDLVHLTEVKLDLRANGIRADKAEIQRRLQRPGRTVEVDV